MFFSKSCTHFGADWRPALAVLALLWFAPSYGREPNKETVSVYVNVEKGDALVGGLAQGNFRLYEDGQPVPFRLEEPETPASIALLVEYSLSSGYYLDEIEAAIRGFLKSAPEDNWYALATFDRTVEVRADFTKQTGKIPEAFIQSPTPLWSEVNTYDAIYEMLDKLGRLPGRRILIVVGSGMDTFSEHTMDDVKKKIEAENVTVFCAGLGAALRTTVEPYLTTEARLTLIQAQSFLKMLADKSGGYAWAPNHFNAFPDVIQGAMQSISLQYRLVYDSKALRSGKFRKIKVEAFRVIDDKREDFKVRVRDGWR
jgi:VWFA-related protein